MISTNKNLFKEAIKVQNDMLISESTALDNMIVG